MYSFKLYLKDWWVLAFLTAMVGLLFFSWWYLLTHLPATSENVFLHYNSIFGVDLVGPWNSLLQIPLMGILIFAVNWLLSWFWYRSNKFISRLTLFVALTAEFGIAVIIYLLVGINS